MDKVPMIENSNSEGSEKAGSGNTAVDISGGLYYGTKIRGGSILDGFLG